MPARKPKTTITELLAAVATLNILLNFDKEDGTWSAEAVGAGRVELGYNLGGFPCDSFQLALEDCTQLLENRLCELMIIQLTPGEAAILMSAANVNSSGYTDQSHLLEIPNTAAKRSLEDLSTRGLLHTDGPSNSHRWFGKSGESSTTPIPSSGYSLTEWGRKVLRDLWGSAIAKKPATLTALKKLRTAPLAAAA